MSYRSNDTPISGYNYGLTARFDQEALHEIMYKSQFGLYGNAFNGSSEISAPITQAADLHHSFMRVLSTLNMNNYRLFCNDTIYVESTGVIHANGNNASGATRGAAVANGTVSPASALGGNGSTNAKGVAGANQTSASLCSNGGQGGNSGARTGGAGGTATPPIASMGTLRLPFHLEVCQFWGTSGSANNIRFRSGGGGGGGAGSTGSDTGGGGGSAAAGLFIACPHIRNEGIISAIGGFGANGVAGNGGGGGGGSGGFIIIVSRFPVSGNTPSVLGGTKGLKIGTGIDGVDGGVGFYLNLVC